MKTVEYIPEKDHRPLPKTRALEFEDALVEVAKAIVDPEAGVHPNPWRRFTALEDWDDPTLVQELPGGFTRDGLAVIGAAIGKPLKVIAGIDGRTTQALGQIPLVEAVRDDREQLLICLVHLLKQAGVSQAQTLAFFAPGACSLATIKRYRARTPNEAYMPSARQLLLEAGPKFWSLFGWGSDFDLSREDEGVAQNESAAAP